MKRILTIFAVLLLAVTAWAQNPKLTYQAVVRDNANMLVTNSTVDVTISVLRTDNSPQYTQSFDNVPTNQNGLFTLFFGGENGWDNVNWIHSKIAVAITLPDLSVVKDTTDVNAVPLAISTINSGTSGPSTQVQSDWAQTDQTDPSFIQNKPEIGDSVNTILVNGQYVTITMMDGRHYLTSDSVVIVNMRNNINNNTTNIINNTTNIEANTTNINNNTANIATNTTNINNNTANIATNTTNISNNTANIATNTTNISNNTTNIATNTANIAANTTNIGNNTTNINNLILHTKKAAIRDSVAGQIHDSIAAIGATITQNHTHANMSVLNATTAPFTTANKTTLDSLAAAGAEQNVQANWNETNAANDAFIRNKPSITDTVNTILANRNYVTNTVMDGRHYLTSDSVVIVNMRNNINNNTTNIINNTTKIEANTTNINNNTANIASNTTNINNNTANIATNTTNISNNTANIATNTTNISNNTTNISNNTANIATNSTNISNNTANIATNTTNISNNTTNIATNTTNISNNTANIAANTTNISNNTANIATNTTNINNLILRTKKAAIRDSVAGQIHDSIAANNLVTVNNNQIISGDKTFTGTTIVPSGFTLGATTASNCNNVAVNACDLLAVFDSIQRRMDNLESVIEDLREEVANLRDTVRILRGDSVPTVTVSIPTVTTSPVTDITETTAACGGSVTADGGASVTARGVCWSTDANPTIDGSHTTDGTGTGSYTSTITGLTAGNTYHVRTYATNSEGTAYGEEVSFTTQNTTPVTPVDGQPCPGAATVTDHQGNVYHTVQIGSQCWTRENMRCTTSPSTGTTILEASPTSYSYTGKKAYYVDGSSSNTSTYGLLYNWNAAVDTFNTAYGETSTNTDYNNAVNVAFSGHRRGICPQGWHVPSDAEWTQLTTYVSSLSEYVCGGGDNNIAKALASTTGWNSNSSTCAVGNNPSGNNATGFYAVPAGCYFGGYDYFGLGAYFWSATQLDSHYAYFCALYDNYGFVIRGNDSKYQGYSVRCLRDEAGGSTASLPTVTTSPVTDITETTATCGGNVTADGGASVTARGVCWSTGANPTIDGSHTTDGTGTGSFTSTITGLTAGTTYHVRTYATNSEGTAYGEEVSFTTQNTTPVTPVDGQPCPGAATVTDHEGNVYNTVQIGSQCWMKENMRTTRYADGTSISNGGTNISTSTAYRYFPLGDTNNVSTYGYLYNWKAVMRNSSSSSANPSGVQGICPTGWHVPSDAEWTQLTTYVKSQSEYVCEGCSGTDDEWKTHCIAKVLASTTGWNSSSNTCAVGNNPSGNNATGFSAVPAGDYGSYYYFGEYANFWSATQNGSNAAYGRNLLGHYANVLRDNYYTGVGFSVRCLRDEAGGSAASLPTVTTSPVTDITETTAACGGNVTADGGADVTARGVCWSTDANPTIDGSHTTDGTGTGSFSSTITGLTAGTTYHVRTYATNSEGTAYGEEVSFTTQNTTPVTPADGQPCPGAPTVTDHQGNIYNTVQIGSQCWTRENMRCTTSPSTGTTILEATPTGSYTGKKAYYVFGSSSNTSTYGLLYNWNAAVDTFNTAYGETSTNTSSSNAVNVTFSGHRRGICPQGWHVPSDAEWTQLTTYVKSQPDYVCEGCSGTDDEWNTYCIAKALASTTGWNSSSNTCAVGNNPSGNNATGFYAVPAGGYNGYYNYFGGGAYFWSATQYFSDNAYYRRLLYNYITVGRGDSGKDNGYSVRCLRD